MGSSRLPGKVLRLIAGRVLLDHVIGRLQDLRTPIEIVVATSTEPRDDLVATHCKGRVNCFRGSELDVLDRYVSCAQAYCFDHVVRLTADNPFTDIEELDRLIDLHLAKGYDYTHSFGELPIGGGAEIFTLPALQVSHRDGHAPNHREHVNEYIQENPDLFRIGVLTVPQRKKAPSLRLTVDTPADYERACHLAEHAKSSWLTTEEAILLCWHSV